MSDGLTREERLTAVARLMAEGAERVLAEREEATTEPQTAAKQDEGKI